MAMMPLYPLRIYAPPGAIPRWVKIHRPFLVVGGELTLEGLDLVFDDTHKYYEAPFQVKSQRRHSVDRRFWKTAGAPARSN